MHICIYIHIRITFIGGLISMVALQKWSMAIENPKLISVAMRNYGNVTTSC